MHSGFTRRNFVEREAPPRPFWRRGQWPGGPVGQSSGSRNGETAQCQRVRGDGRRNHRRHGGDAKGAGRDDVRQHVDHLPASIRCVTQPLHVRRLARFRHPQGGAADPIVGGRCALVALPLSSTPPPMAASIITLCRCLQGRCRLAVRGGMPSSSIAFADPLPADHWHRRRRPQ